MAFDKFPYRAFPTGPKTSDGSSVRSRPQSAPHSVLSPIRISCRLAMFALQRHQAARVCRLLRHQEAAVLVQENTLV